MSATTAAMTSETAAHLCGTNEKGYEYKYGTETPPRRIRRSQLRKEDICTYAAEPDGSIVELATEEVIRVRRQQLVARVV